MIPKTESRIQQEIVQWFRNNYCLKHHTPKCEIFSVPNERSNVKEQTRMISTGLKSGVADLIVLLPNGKTVFIECKDEKGRQSERQIMFEESVVSLGFQYFVVRSLEDFQKIALSFNYLFVNL
jgi:hypothetical protein